MLYLRDPISIFISSWDYYGFDKILKINIEEFADMVSQPGKFSEGIVPLSIFLNTADKNIDLLSLILQCVPI